MKNTTFTIASFLLIMVALTMATLQETKAQQDARYSQYMFNGLVHNPGYAGSAESTCFTGIYRKQWVDIEGSPQTISFSGHTSLGLYDKIGIGGFMEYDEIGVHQRIRAYAAYAYRFRIGRGRLGFGVQGGILNLRSNFTEIETQAEPGDMDGAFTQDERTLLPNFGVGLFFQTNKVYLGASAPHLLNNDLYDGLPNIAKVPQQYRHYILTGGVVVPLGRKIKLKPSALVKMVPGNAPTQVDANLSVLLFETIWLGSSFRFEEKLNPESIDFILSFQLENGVRIGYAYDYTLSELADFTSGSHEIMLGYDFGKKGERIKTPRYF